MRGAGARRLVLVGAALAVVITAVVGGVLWREARSRDAACDRAYVDLDAAIRRSAASGPPHVGADLQTQVRQCMDDGWPLGRGTSEPQLRLLNGMNVELSSKTSTATYFATMRRR